MWGGSKIMDSKVTCLTCLNYVNGHDSKKMCLLDGKYSKVPTPTSPPCNNEHNTFINALGHICIDCDHQFNEGGRHYCRGVVDVVDGEPKLCEDARNNECGKLGQYYVGK